MVLDPRKGDVGVRVDKGIEVETSAPYRVADVHQVVQMLAVVAGATAVE